MIGTETVEEEEDSDDSSTLRKHVWGFIASKMDGRQKDGWNCIVLLGWTVGRSSHWSHFCQHTVEPQLLLFRTETTKFKTNSCEVHKSIVDSNAFVLHMDHTYAHMYLLTDDVQTIPIQTELYKHLKIFSKAHLVSGWYFAKVTFCGKCTECLLSQTEQLLKTPHRHTCDYDCRELRDSS